MGYSDEELVQMACVEAAHSLDTTKVGAVFVDSVTRSHVLATGHNHPPSGVDASVPDRWQRPEKYKWIEHAERNAIYSACRRGVSLADSTAAVNWFPCCECARALIQCGVKHLVAIAPDESHATYGADFATVRVMLREAGIVIFLYGFR